MSNTIIPSNGNGNKPIPTGQYPAIARKATFSAIKSKLGYPTLTGQDLEDMLQEAWVAAFRCSHKPAPYQFVAARRAVVSYFFRYTLARKDARPPGSQRQPSIWENATSLSILNEEKLMVSPPDPPAQGDTVEAEDLIELLLAAYKTSPKYTHRRIRKDARVLALLAQGYNNNGIAQEMGVSTSAIRSRRARLRRTLKAYYDERCPKPDPRQGD